MVNICEKHANDYDLIFSTDKVRPEKSKTVSVAFNHEGNSDELMNIVLNGDPLPWKKSAKHIGNLLNENGTMESDVLAKRAQFIDNCMSLNIEFECLPAECQVRLLKLYNSHFTGSCTWRFSDESHIYFWRLLGIKLRQ